LTALGNNRDTDGTCPGFSQVTAAQLNLGPLLNNGGPTNTHALLSGSVAINAGNQSLCTAGGITTDQRGVARDAICDIGSFEFVNNPPVASFTHACQGLRCRFDGSGSSDPDGAIARYAWDFGDGATGSGAVVRRIYAAAGTYMVTLKVIDPERASDTETKAVTVTATP
jgi:PKD repeat protein